MTQLTGENESLTAHPSKPFTMLTHSSSSGSRQTGFPARPYPNNDQATAQTWIYRPQKRRREGNLPPVRLAAPLVSG